MTSATKRPPDAQSAPADLRAGPEAERLYEAYADQLLRFCVKRLGSRPEAEDAVQLTFLYAFRALQRGVVPEAEAAWLYAIAANVCRWQQRTHARRGPLATELDLDRVAASGSTSAEQRGLCRELRAALRSLPATQRRALVLREWHGLPSHEVAARLGMSAAATYALLTRARQSFVKAFEAQREAVLGTQLVLTLHQLRHHLKALFATASAKTAAVATVTAVGVGGVAVQQGLDRERRLPPPPPAVADAPSPAVTAKPVKRATAAAGGRLRDVGSRDTRAGEPRAHDDRGEAVVVPPRAPRRPDDAPAPEAEPGAAPTTEPAPPASSPADPPPEPQPSLPVELPPPTVDRPEADLPPIDPPPVDLPPIEVPGTDTTVDVPPVDLPAIDPPPVVLPELPTLPGPH